MNIPKIRTGHGFDLHRLVKGRKLILGGIEIPHHLGLLGHSDADCLIHALADAMLGALGLPTSIISRQRSSNRISIPLIFFFMQISCSRDTW